MRLIKIIGLITILVVISNSLVIAESIYVKTDALLEKEPDPVIFVVTSEMKQQVLGLPKITVHEVKKLLGCNNIQGQKVINALIRDNKLISYGERYRQLYPSVVEWPPEIIDDRININTASKEELMTINGIGPTYASRIIEYKQGHGDYKTTEEIMKVRGIGTITYAKIKDYIKI